MIGFLKMTKLDFITIKPQLLTYLVIVWVVLVFGYNGNASVILISLAIAWFEALFVTNIFVIQEKNRLDHLYGSLSISLSEIILGRYVFVLIIYIVSFIISIIFFTIEARFFNVSINGIDTLVGFGISLLYFSIITGIQFPIYFRMGYTKARAWSIIVFIPMLLAIMLLMSIFSNVVEWIQSNQYTVIIISIFTSCIIQFVSYQISVVSYRNRI